MKLPVYIPQAAVWLLRLAVNSTLSRSLQNDPVGGMRFTIGSAAMRVSLGRLNAGALPPAPVRPSPAT
jgi:hypothetical protein